MMAARRQRAGMPLPRVALVALVLAPLVAGCLPTAVTSEGRAIGDLYGVFVMIAAGVFLLVYALATFAIVRYRVLRRGGGEPRQIEGNDRIEALWTAIPVLIVGGLFVGTLCFFLFLFLTFLRWLPFVSASEVKELRHDLAEDAQREAALP